MRWNLSGVVANAAFASGDRFAIGKWDDTPLGPLTELRWTKPDGARTLLVADQPAADLLGAVYPFDQVELTAVTANGTDRWIEVVAGPVEVQLQAKTGWRVPFKRPAIVTQLVEDRLARQLFRSRAYERTTTGVRAWYRADVVRPVVAGWATVDGRDLGGLRERPTIAALRPLLEDPSGRLDEVVRAAARARVNPASG
jgi:hypothetical protein